jgi:hypothetical protein
MVKMGTDYSPNNFIKKTPNELLEQYFQSEEIEPVVEIEGKGEEKKLKRVKISELDEMQFEPIQKLIGLQTEEKQKKIGADFHKINEIACKAGTRCLIEESQYEGHKLDISVMLENMSSHYECAMYMYLNHKKVFKNSGHFQRMDGTTFKKIYAKKGINPNQEDSELKDFKAEIIKHYKEEGRGKHCKVEVFKRFMPERYCYFVYIQDHPDLLDQFEGAEFRQTPVNPAFKVVFVYHPNSGRIEHNAKGKYKQKNQLHDIFCQDVLKMKGKPDKNARMYDLQKLKNRFDFKPRDAKDNITLVKLKYIELKINNERSIAFADKGKGTNIYNLIDDALGLHDISSDKAIDPKRITLDDVTVTKVKIQILFRRMPDDRRTPSATFEITTPDSCTLKDTPLHLIAQKYVEKWGFISDETIETKKDDDAPETVEKKSA